MRRQWNVNMKQYRWTSAWILKMSGWKKKTRVQTSALVWLIRQTSFSLSARGILIIDYKFVTAWSSTYQTARLSFHIMKGSTAASQTFWKIPVCIQPAFWLQRLKIERKELWAFLCINIVSLWLHHVGQSHRHDVEDVVRHPRCSVGCRPVWFTTRGKTARCPFLSYTKTLEGHKPVCRSIHCTLKWK